MPVQSPEKQNIHQRVVEQVIAAVQSGEMAPGQKLASEIQLAAQFQISRNILREALKSLEVLGIVESGHGRGTFISPQAQQRVANVEFIRALASDQTVSQLLETRIILEPGLAEFAAQRRTADDLERLWATVGNMVRSYEDESRSNALFHLTIARSSGCEVPAKYLESVLKQLQYSDYGTFVQSLTQKHLAQEVAEHQKILECIVERDGKGARTLMYEHLVDRYNMIRAFQREFK